MKKITLLSLLLVASTAIFAISPPTVITGTAAWNTATSSGTYCNDNFDDLTNTTNAYLSYARPITADPNGYAFVVESRSANPLNDLLGAVATSADFDPIYIRNTGRNNIAYFGGTFFNVSTLGNALQDSIKITIDNYVYKFLALTAGTFRGFIFTEPFTEVKIESVAPGNTIARCAALTRICWGSNLVPTNINEQKKPVVIFPNPTTEGITVNATGTLSILSTAGQLVVSQAVTEGSYVSLSAIPKGLYVVKIETATASLQEKLIKK